MINDQFLFFFSFFYDKLNILQFHLMKRKENLLAYMYNVHAVHKNKINYLSFAKDMCHIQN